MSSDASREREIRQIIIEANGGEATDEQLARLDAMIREDESLATYAASLVDQQASLAWQGSLGEGHAPLSHSAHAVPSSPNTSAERGHIAPTPRTSLLLANWTWPAIAVGIAFVLGVVIARPVWNADSAEPDIRGDVAVSGAEPRYEARLTRSTACLWDSNSLDSPQIGSWLTSGESLHLLEGLAEFTFEWSRGGSATLSLEGPAAMVLTSDGMPTLRFGRLTATINSTSRPFVLETPVGRLVVSEFGSIGAGVFGNDGEIHVFDGEATLLPAWRTSNQSTIVPLTITSGQAIRVQEGAGGELSITHHPSDKEYFVAQLSMSSDALIIPPAYVRAVEESAPVAYWRFERDAWPQVANQMGPQYEGHVVGALGVAAYHGNQVVDFGVTDQGGEVICDDRFGDELQNAYSIEFWIKPSHYHIGSVISLIRDADIPNGVVAHSLLLEFGGTGLIPRTNHHPGRLRFLHRSPASNETELGTSCYSTDAYTLRKWQHVVATKDATRMRLYINGELAAEGEDPTPMPSDMRLLIGRLYPSRQVRPFIGQLDELAVYGRALPVAEIKAHYRLVRPPQAVSLSKSNRSI